MATIIYDLVDGSEVNIDNTRVGFVRPGRITDFDVSGSQDQILARAIDTAGLPARFTPHPYFPYATLQRYQFFTQKGVNWKIWFKLFYDTPEGRNPAGDSLFTLERHRQLISTRTSKHPKDWADLNLTWHSPVVNANNQQDIRPVQAAEMEYLQPHLTLTATGYIIGEPPDEYESTYGSVNKTTWQGYGKGYWLYMGADDITRDFGNSYTVRLTFLTKVIQDWSQTAAYRDHATGLFLPVDPADSSQALAMSYVYGQKNWNGLIKVGFYPLAEFNDIFGF